MNYKDYYHKYLDQFNIFLNKYFDNLQGVEPKLLDAMKYSLFPGGKRIRPIIMLAMYELCGGTSKVIYNFAAAIEMIHTYSLIHDDLPCMDGDTVRRGKPCNHIVYGEDIALLAGDALLTLAFDIISGDQVGYEQSFSDLKILKCVNILSRCAGCRGMISGQSFDLKWSGNIKNRDELLKIYELKTGKLILASAKIGALLGGACDEKIKLAEEFGKNIGISFQIVDDIIDGELGNLSLLKNANELVHDLTTSAKEKLSHIGNGNWFLNTLADNLAGRKK